MNNNRRREQYIEDLFEPDEDSSPIMNEINNEDWLTTDNAQQLPNMIVNKPSSPLDFSLEKECQTLCINHNTTWIAACFKNSIELYRFANEQWGHCQSIKLDYYIRNLKFNHNSTSFAYIDVHLVYIWKLTDDTTWSRVQSIGGNLNQDSCYWVQAFALNHDSTLLAIASQGILSINMQINQWILSQTIQCPQNVHQLSFNHNSTMLGSLTERQLIVIWKQDSSQKWIVYQTVNDSNLRQFQYLQTQIITLGYSNSIVVWQFSDTNILKKQCTLRGLRHKVNILMTNKGQPVIANGVSRDSVIVWRVGLNGRWKHTNKIHANKLICDIGFTLMFSSNTSDIIAEIDNKSVKMIS